MGGGYISCGDWMGNDKSGSASTAVFEQLERFMSGPDLEAFNLFMNSPVDPTEMEAGHFDETLIVIPQTIAVTLIEPLERYRDELSTKLGHPLPVAAPSLDQKAGIDPTKAKYGAGDGWRLYCVADLIEACQRSRKTNAPVEISWD